MCEYMVSVIIPVYKTERYLRECVDSVLSQTQNGVEIILVDDSSPDTCPQICDEYAAKYNSISVIHKENGGVGQARNAGVKAARGEYVMLLDSDDALDGSEALHLLYENAVKNGADISAGNYRYYYGASCSEIKKLNLKTESNRDTKEFRFTGFYAGGHLSYAWGKLYRRAFLLENNIENPAYRFTQDKLFNFYCYMCGARYAFTDESVQLYRINPESVTFKYKQNYGEGWLNIGHDFVEYVENSCYNGDVFDLTAYHVLFGALFVAKQEYLFVGKNKISAMKKALSSYGDDALTQRAAAALSSGKYAPPGIMLKTEVKFVSKRLLKKKYTMLSLGIAMLVKLKKI